ncbi:MAG: hypothetical protein VX016_07525, partial [Verrucomicrobiota bacterium]|nr:hypothetical protein [Verrucomicrobiota bacterium]
SAISVSGSIGKNSPMFGCPFTSNSRYPQLTSPSDPRSLGVTILLAWEKALCEQRTRASRAMKLTDSAE